MSRDVSFERRRRQSSGRDKRASTANTSLHHRPNSRPTPAIPEPDGTVQASMKQATVGTDLLSKTHKYSTFTSVTVGACLFIYLLTCFFARGLLGTVQCTLFAVSFADRR